MADSVSNWEMNIPKLLWSDNEIELEVDRGRDYDKNMELKFLISLQAPFEQNLVNGV